MIDDVVRSYVEGATARSTPRSGISTSCGPRLKTLYPVSLTIDEAIDQAGGEKTDLTLDFLLEELTADAQAAYDEREEDLGAEVLRELERRVLLSVLDRKWREHLYEMDYLQEGIGLRAMAQRDPLVEYQREGFDMFQAMMEAIKEESVGFLFNLEVEVADPEPTAAESVEAAESEALPQLDLTKLAPAEPAREDEPAAGNGAHPQIKAKGLDRGRTDKPLVYSSPELGSEAPSVQTGSASGEKAAAGAESATARRQQARSSNPNRGSRGNKGGANRRKR